MSAFDDAVRELYEGPADAFVTTRTHLAKRARNDGDADLAKRITGLRRPSAAAAIVNHLGTQALADVFAAGAALRAAQTRLDAPEMKRLTAERQRAIDTVMTKVDASAGIRDEVRATLLAATADPGAQDAVASGALVKAIHYSGWGEVDLADALAHRDAASLGRVALRVVDPPEAGTGAGTDDRPPETPGTRADEPEHPTSSANAVDVTDPGADHETAETTGSREGETAALEGDRGEDSAAASSSDLVAAARSWLDASHGDEQASATTSEDAEPTPDDAVTPAQEVEAAAPAGGSTPDGEPDPVASADSDDVSAPDAPAPHESGSDARARLREQQRAGARAVAERNLQRARSRLVAAENAYRAARAARVAAREGLAAAEEALADFD